MSKRLGLALLLGGVILFLVATNLRGGYDSFEGSMKAVGIVAGVAGLVVLVVSGRSKP